MTLRSYLAPLSDTEQEKSRKELIDEQIGGGASGASSSNRTRTFSAGAVASLLGLSGSYKNNTTVKVTIQWSQIRIKTLVVSNLPTVERRVAAAGTGVTVNPQFRGNGSFWMIHEVVEVSGLKLVLDHKGLLNSGLDADLSGLVGNALKIEGPVSAKAGTTLARDSSDNYVMDIADGAVVAVMVREHNKNDVLNYFRSR